MNILFISKSIKSSSTRYRALQFYPLFEGHGYTPHHATASGGFFAILNTLFRASQADTVIVLRKTFPFIVTVLLRLVSKRLIFDLDDAIFCRSDGSFSKTRMNRFSSIVKQCDHVFAGNKFLAEQSLKFNSRVSIIPTCLDTSKYNIGTPKPKNHTDIVWIGSKSTSKYLLDILPILETAAKKHPTLRLKVIADFQVTDAKIQTLNIAWNEATEAAELASAHIGIAPMIENDWTQGKCALKVLQYMAAKLPVISSNIGVNGEAIISGETGYLVTHSTQWLDAISQLYNDLNKQQLMGLAGQEKVNRHYDIHIVFSKILTALA